MSGITFRRERERGGRERERGVDVLAGPRDEDGRLVSRNTAVVRDGSKRTLLSHCSVTAGAYFL